MIERTPSAWIGTGNPCISTESLRSLLAKSKEPHTRLGNTTHEYLKEYHDEGKGSTVMAKMISKMKTNMKQHDQGPDTKVADLITGGCNMGVFSLCQNSPGFLPEVSSFYLTQLHLTFFHRSYYLITQLFRII